MNSQNSPSISIRQANTRDVQLAARVISLSMGPLADYFFGDMRLPVEDILAGLYRTDDSRFSWRVAHVAEADGQPVAMLLSFPGWELNRRELRIGRGVLSLCGLPDVLRLSIRALFIAGGIESERDEYHIANLGVLLEYQGLGIGSRLMSYAEQEARQAGLSRCSLIVDTENPSARRLYERLGYQVVLTKTYSKSVEHAHAGYHRMVKEVA